MMTTEMPGLAGRLQSLRGRAGLTQRQLAERAGLNVAQVRNLEQGRTPDPRLSTLQALAGALGVTLDELAREGER